MTTMTNNPLLLGLATMRFSRGFADQLFETFSEDQLMHQPTPGANHALWIMGHLPVADDGFNSIVTGEDRQLSDEWQQLFGYGSEPRSDRSAYPALDEIKREYIAQRKRIISTFESLTDDQLLKPLGEDWKMFAANNAELIAALAGHECMHNGQLTMIRKSLGMAPVLG